MYESIKAHQESVYEPNESFQAEDDLNQMATDSMEDPKRSFGFENPFFGKNKDTEDDTREFVKRRFLKSKKSENM